MGSELFLLIFLVFPEPSFTTAALSSATVSLWVPAALSPVEAGLSTEDEAFSPLLAPFCSLVADLSLDDDLSVLADAGLSLSLELSAGLSLSVGGVYSLSVLSLVTSGFLTMAERSAMVMRSRETDLPPPPPPLSGKRSPDDGLSDLTDLTSDLSPDDLRSTITATLSIPPSLSAPPLSGAAGLSPVEVIVVVVILVAGAGLSSGRDILLFLPRSLFSLILLWGKGLTCRPMRGQIDPLSLSLLPASELPGVGSSPSPLPSLPRSMEEPGPGMEMEMGWKRSSLPVCEVPGMGSRPSPLPVSLHARFRRRGGLAGSPLWRYGPSARRSLAGGPPIPLSIPLPLSLSSTLLLFSAGEGGVGWRGRPGGRTPTL